MKPIERLFVVGLVLTIVCLLVLPTVPQVSANPSWWDSSWTKRRAITITPASTPYYVASDNLIYSDDAETQNSDSIDYILVKSWTSTVSGVLRIKFDLRTSDNNADVLTGKIYKNGSPVGTEQGNWSTTWQTFTEDIGGWQTGDTVELWLANIDAGLYTVYARNFRIYGSFDHYEYTAVPENYQYKIMLPFYDNSIRFLENEASGVLNYWVENYTADNMTAWVRRLENADNKIYVYYSNPSVGAAENGDNVFLFFDDFNDGSLDANKWDKIGTPTESGGFLTLDSDFEKVDSTSTWNRNVALRFMARIGINTTGSPWVGFRGPNEAVPLIEVLANIQTSGQVAGRTYITSSTFTSNFHAVNEWHVYDIAWRTDNAAFWVDNVYKGSITTQVSTSAKPVEIEGYLGTTNTADWILVRKYVSPEPTVSVGAEESYGAPPSVTPTLPRIIMGMEAATATGGGFPAIATVKVFGTIYTKAENGQIWAMLLDNTGTPVNTATAKLNVYYENMSKYLDNMTMTYVTGSLGVYTYDFLAPSVYGVYLCTVWASWGSNNAYGSGEFQVSSTWENINNIKENVSWIRDYLTNTILPAITQARDNAVLARDNAYDTYNYLVATKAVVDNAQVGINTTIGDLATQYAYLTGTIGPQMSQIQENVNYTKSQADNIKAEADNLQAGMNVSIAEIEATYTNTNTIITETGDILSNCSMIYGYIEFTVMGKLNIMENKIDNLSNGATISAMTVPSPWIKDTENSQIYCQIKDNNGNPLESENVKLCIWKRDNTLFVENVIMDHLSRGIYQYQMISPAEEGHYAIDIFTDSGIYGHGVLQVIDPPAGPQGISGENGTYGTSQPIDVGASDALPIAVIAVGLAIVMPAIFFGARRKNETENRSGGIPYI